MNLTKSSCGESVSPLELQDKVAELRALVNRSEFYYYRKPEGQWQVDQVDDLRLLTTHYNGYVREKAVIILGLLKAEQALEEIITRLNDWVQPVRLAAQNSLALILAQHGIAVLVPYLPTLFKLQQCKRDDHQTIIDSIMAQFCQQENQHYLIEALHSAQPLMARLALQLLIEYQILSPQQLISLAINHDDLRLRLQVMQLMAEQPLVKLADLRVALQDNFAPIRLNAFYRLITDYPLEASRAAAGLLFDHYSRLRKQAIALLAEQPMTAADYYVAALTNSASSVSQLCYALWGVRELQLAQASEWANQFIDYQFPSVRRSALQVLVSVNEQKATELLLNAISDPSPMVVKHAVAMLNGRKSSLPLVSLFQLLAKVSYPHQKQACLNLVARLNKWDQLLFLLSLLAVDEQSELLVTQSLLEPSLLKLDLLKLQRWLDNFNRSGIQPSRQQTEQLVVLLEQKKQALPDRLYRHLKQTIDYFVAH